MRRIITALGVFAALSLVIPHATAEEASISVQGGSLSTTASNVAFTAATLTGANQTVNANASSAWSTVDSLGTGAAWDVTMSSTDLVSAAGSVETTARTIAVSNLNVSAGTVTAGDGSDPATGIVGASNLALSSTDQNLLAAPGPHKGTYSYTPAFALSIPANAFRSNYSGAVGSTALNPYVATVTITTA